MAHDTRRLRRYASVPLSGTNIGFFAYATSNTAAEVVTAGYFNASRATLTVGSMIDIIVGVGGTLDNIRVRVTAVPASGNVTVAYDGVAAGS